MEKECREVRSERKNLASVEGMIVFPFKKSTIPGRRGLYETYIDIWRSSSTIDWIRLAVPGNVLELSRDYTRERVTVKDRFRSCNQECGGKRRLILYISAEEIKLTGSGTDKNDANSIGLEGFVCKPPVYRKTPLGRKITDVMLAVNDPYWRSDYIPCIFWGKDAMTASGLEVGDRIRIEGRAQRRCIDGDGDVSREAVEWLISDQPTEYDVETVLNQIDELNENEFCYGNVVRIIKAGGLN